MATKFQLNTHVRLGAISVLDSERTKNANNRVYTKQLPTNAHERLRSTDGGRAAAGRRATCAERRRRTPTVRRAGVPSAAPGGRVPVLPFVGRIDRAGRSTAPAARYPDRGNTLDAAAAGSVLTLKNSERKKIHTKTRY